MQRLGAAEFLAKQQHFSKLVDVRSPSEFAAAHIPGAVNIPLLDDQERHLVGTTYVQEGPDAARLLGFRLVGQNLAEKAQAALTLNREKEPMGVYCWRGGERSASMAWLFESFGIPCFVLQGGYKRYRHHVLLGFQRPKKLVILGGKTGSGKTHVLRELALLGEQVIDLEGLAHHKGSAFGWVNQNPQPRTEMFENLLFQEWNARADEQRLWLEDESKNIGSIFLPDALWTQMRAAPVVFLEVPVLTRVPQLVADYGSAPIDDLRKSLDKIAKRLGGQLHRQCCLALEQKDYSLVAQATLEYYDRCYLHGLSKRTATSVTMVASDTVDARENALKVLSQVASQPTEAH